jgi:UDP-2,3-diacylglucosamine hydrolase
MTERLFISDLHLSAAAPELFALFQRFIDQHTHDIDQLFILGDLVDAWIGDDDDSVFVEELKRTLTTLPERGIELFFMVGNRDFLLGQDFLSQIPATLLPDPTIIEVMGQRVLLTHGDGLCTDDVSYQAFKSQVRSADWQSQFLSQPLAQRRLTAQHLRELSQQAGATKAEAIMDVNTDAVDALMTEHQVSVIIHGHTHRPARHPLGDMRERIVLGDWSTDTPPWVCRSGSNGLIFQTLATVS